MQTINSSPRHEQAFSFPSVPDYERQKGFRVIRLSPDAGSLERLAQFGLRKENRRAELRDLFDQRISCALISCPERACPIFPGHLVAAAGNANNGTQICNRGVLFYDQSKVVPAKQCACDDNPMKHIVVAPVQTEQPFAWLWKTIDRPSIQCLQGSPERSAESDTDDAWRERIGELVRRQELVQAIALVRSKWGCSATTIQYTEEVLRDCSLWLKRLADVQDSETILRVLFEMEAYASFIAALDQLELIGGGRFAGTWVEVGMLSLEKFRQTELCQTKRLSEELVNLVTRGFAPIVVNETLCVADGNHRLTAAWIWNILCATAHVRWDINDREFQEAVRCYINKTVIGAVTAHEALRHLAAFLVDANLRDVLHRRMRPVAASARIIDKLVATVLPEHISGAVVKPLYDSGEAVCRAEPLLYDLMSVTPNAVLPARASYHFTDRALLPWFPVIDVQPQEAEHRRHASAHLMFPSGCRLR